MIRVVQVITALERGGAQRVALESAARLQGPAFDVHLVSGDGGALAQEARARLGTRWHVVPDLRNAMGRHDLTALFALGRLLDRLHATSPGPLIVHTHSSKAGILGRLAASALPGVTIIHTVHGFGLRALGPRARPYLQLAEAVASRVTDTLVFVSEHDRAQARALALTPRSGTRVIRAGVEVAMPATRHEAEAFGQRARAALGIAAHAPVALTVANMKAQKDPLFHVDVLAAWRAHRPDAALIFLGDGPLRAAMTARARACGVEGALHIPGFVDDPTPFFAAANVYLLASRWEGLPCAALEAVAWGLPVVVRHEGWADELDFCDALYRFPPETAPTALARALEEAVDGAMAGSPQATPLPRAFTRAGMLEELGLLYRESAPRPA